MLLKAFKDLKPGDRMIRGGFSFTVLQVPMFKERYLDTGYNSMLCRVHQKNVKSMVSYVKDLYGHPEQDVAVLSKNEWHPDE